MFHMPELVSIKQVELVSIKQCIRGSLEKLHKLVQIDKCRILVKSLCARCCISDIEILSPRINFFMNFLKREESKKHRKTLIHVCTSCKLQHRLLILKKYLEVEFASVVH